MSESGGKIEKKENPWGWLPDVELSLAGQDSLLAALPRLGTLREQRVVLIETLAQTFSRPVLDMTDWLGAIDQ